MEVQLFFNDLVSISIYLLIACSYSIIYYPTKFFHIAHAVVITSGAYFTFFFANKFPFSLSIILGISFAVFVGLLCEILVYRQMRKRNATPFSYLIASIGLYIMLQNCISLCFGDDTKTINTATVAVGHKMFGAYITTIQILTILISILLFAGIIFFYKYTKPGKAIRAVASNAELCNIYGINSNKIILVAFCIGSALAGAAGILSAIDTSMTPTFGFNLLLYGVVAMVIGGVGSNKGLLGGALLVASAQHLSAYFIDSKWMNGTAYVVLILFLIYKPLGFSGKRLKKAEIQ